MTSKCQRQFSMIGISQAYGLLLHVLSFPPGCNCNLNGSRSDLCDPNSGACECFDNVVGRDCSSCAQDFYGSNEFVCLPCACNSTGRF